MNRIEASDVTICPACDAELGEESLLGRMGNYEHWRCRQCGWTWTARVKNTQDYDFDNHVRDIVMKHTQSHTGISHAKLVEILKRFGNSDDVIEKGLKALEKDGYMKKDFGNRWRWNVEGKFKAAAVEKELVAVSELVADASAMRLKAITLLEDAWGALNIAKMRVQAVVRENPEDVEELKGAGVAMEKMMHDIPALKRTIAAFPRR